MKQLKSLKYQAGFLDGIFDFIGGFFGGDEEEAATIQANRSGTTLMQLKKARIKQDLPDKYVHILAIILFSQVRDRLKSLGSPYLLEGGSIWVCIDILRPQLGLLGGL